LSSQSSVRTVALSRQRGSGGSYVGRHVAERLGFRYIDRDLLRDASQYLHEQPAAGSSPEAVATGPSGSSWWPWLTSAFSRGCLDGVYVPPSESVTYEGDLFEIEHRLIREIADGEAAVIVGRGAAQTLRGRPGVFSVHAYAPEPWRIDRVQRLYGLDRHAAAQMVRHSDRDRSRFIRRLVGTDWTDPGGYDLAVDTALGLDVAVDLIVSAVAHGIEASRAALR
jgi:CMP/dCMP kinase